MGTRGTIECNKQIWEYLAGDVIAYRRAIEYIDVRIRELGNESDANGDNFNGKVFELFCNEHTLNHIYGIDMTTKKIKDKVAELEQQDNHIEVVYKICLHQYLEDQEAEEHRLAAMLNTKEPDFLLNGDNKLTPINDLHVELEKVVTLSNYQTHSRRLADTTSAPTGAISG